MSDWGFSREHGHFSQPLTRQGRGAPSLWDPELMQFQADWTLRVGALACLGVGFGDLDQSAPLGDSFYLNSWRFTFYQAKIGWVGGPGSQCRAPLNPPTPPIPKHKEYSVLLCLVWKMKVENMWLGTSWRNGCLQEELFAQTNN